MSTPLINPIPGCLSPTTSSVSMGLFSEGGALYAVGFSQYNTDGGGDPNGSPSVVSVFRSVDNGTTWAVQDVANSPELVRLNNNGGVDPIADARAFTCLRHPVNPELWLVYVDRAGSNIRASVFDLTTNTWTATSAAGPNIPYPNDGFAYQSTTAVPQAAFSATTGDLVVMMWDFVPAPALITCRPHTVKLQGGIGGAWTVPQLWPGMPPLVNFADKWYCCSISQGAGGRVHGFMQFFDGSYNAYHYLMEDGLGGVGVAVEAMVGLQLADYSSNCLVDTTVVLIGNNGVQDGLVYAVSVDSPLWAFTAIPPTYNAPFAYALFPDEDGAPPVPVARIAGATGNGIFCGIWDLAVFSIPDLLSPLLWGVVSGGRVGSYGLAASAGGAGSAMSSFTFGVAPGTLATLADTGRKPPLLKPPNFYDCCLDQFRVFVESQLPKIQPSAHACELVEMPGGYMMPAEGREWFEQVSIITPAINPAPGQLVLDFRCPVGYDGIIYGVTNLYLGAGFVQGSGDLIWRVQVGEGWARNMGEMLYSLGAVGQPFPLADQIQVRSSQRVRMFVQTVNASGLIQVGVARMVMGLQGWWYPV